MTGDSKTLAPKPWISGIAPYVPGKSAGADGRPLIKLSANENPLGTGDKAREAFRASQAAADALSRYPDPGANVLRAAIAGERFAEYFYANSQDEAISDYLRNL